MRVAHGVLTAVTAHSPRPRRSRVSWVTNPPGQRTRRRSTRRTYRSRVCQTRLRCTTGIQPALEASISAASAGVNGSRINDARSRQRGPQSSYIERAKSLSRGSNSDASKCTVTLHQVCNRDLMINSLATRGSNVGRTEKTVHGEEGGGFHDQPKLKPCRVLRPGRRRSHRAGRVFRS